VVQIMVTLLNKLQETAQWGGGLHEVTDLSVMNADAIPTVIH